MLTQVCTVRLRRNMLLLCRFAVAMHAFLQAACSDVLACVWRLCAPGASIQTHTACHKSPTPLCPLTTQVEFFSTYHSCAPYFAYSASNLWVML